MQLMMLPNIAATVKISILSVLAFSIRLFTIYCGKEYFSSRVEISTPINDWKRVEEAVFLWQSNLNPYHGNIFHEYPLSLQFYKYLIASFNVNYVLALTDTATAILLLIFSERHFSMCEFGESRKYSICRNIYLIYLLSPISIISCAGLSTSTFTNFLLSLMLVTQTSKYLKPFTCILCALLTCNNIHYGALVLPTFLCMESYSNGCTKEASIDCRTDTQYYRKKTSKASLYSLLLIYTAALVTILLTSYLIMDKSWTFLKATYLFVLRANDLRPNIGMFWYFLTEMFDQFLEFFIWVVQINAFIHIVPISIYLRDQPLFLQYMLLLTSTIFQPYPSLSSIGLITSLLPLWSRHLNHMKYGLIVMSAALTCISFWPIFWHLWITLGTANANFYFGSTLAFTLSLILLMVELFNANGYLVAMQKLEKYKKLHSLPAKEKLTELCDESDAT